MSSLLQFSTHEWSFFVELPKWSSDAVRKSFGKEDDMKGRCWNHSLNGQNLKYLEIQDRCQYSRLATSWASISLRSTWTFHVNSFYKHHVSRQN